jgi:hypothetical protein
MVKKIIALVTTVFIISLVVGCNPRVPNAIELVPVVGVCLAAIDRVPCR